MQENTAFFLNDIDRRMVRGYAVSVNVVYIKNGRKMEEERNS
jgi:hypothetical protein